MYFFIYVKLFILTKSIKNTKALRKINTNVSEFFTVKGIGISQVQLNIYTTLLLLFALHCT